MTSPAMSAWTPSTTARFIAPTSIQPTQQQSIILVNPKYPKLAHSRSSSMVSRSSTTRSTASSTSTLNQFSTHSKLTAGHPRSYGSSTKKTSLVTALKPAYPHPFANPNWTALSLAEKAALYDVMADTRHDETASDPSGFTTVRLILFLLIKYVGFLVWVAMCFTRVPIHFNPDSAGVLRCTVDGWYFIILLQPFIAAPLAFVICYLPVSRNDHERRAVRVLGQGAWKWWKPCVRWVMWTIVATFGFLAIMSGILWPLVKNRSLAASGQSPFAA
ncbi:hypothetical protein BKA62DRAFT_510979 [Auriculariales sp. MPI-PUGE-AT-0066]|nr:hypothetical protein BKA62DRAFT_510979 [Auriculariales sp. MPI-PUGE-AT-0066]